MADLIDIPEISGNVSSEMPQASGNVRGVRGDSAYEVAVRNGYTGTEAEWLASLKGDPGTPGQDGDDGSSPTVSITNITGGHRVTITDAQGTHTVDVMDGEDGHSPVISATKSGKVTTITADGTVIATINDGQDGNDGHSPVITTSKSGKTTTILADGTSIGTVLDGEKGDPGDDYILTEADKAEIAGMVDAPVEDVQIDGTSIVENGVANVPIGSQSQLGVVYDGGTYGYYGVIIGQNGRLEIKQAEDNNIKYGSNGYRPIVSTKQHQSTFYGLAKAAGSDEKNSALPVGQYTDEAKIAIQKMLGIYEPPFELIEDFTLTEEGRFDKTTEPDGTLYNFRGVFIRVFYAANLQTASTGYGRYLFTDSDGAYLSTETGKYTVQTNQYTKFVYIMRNGAMAIAIYSIAAATGGAMTWRHKDSSGIRFDFKNIQRIYMNAADVEPAGTRIQIYAQRAY